MTTGSPDTLPEFDRPPVGEVVLAVAFEPIPGLDLFALADFWRVELRDRFPRVEEQPPYDPPVEDLDGGPRSGGLQLAVVSGVPSPRFWLLSEDDAHLVQLQRAWLARNWRRRPGRPEYPRYGPLREDFSKVLSSWRRFAAERGGGELRPTQCEVTYVNHLDIAELPCEWGELDRIFSIFQAADTHLPVPEMGSFSLQYRLTDETDTPVGRLHVRADPSTRQVDGTPAIVLNLTARGRPNTPDEEGVLRFLDLGHEVVVRSFAELTTAEMHRVWGRTR